MTLTRSNIQMSLIRKNMIVPKGQKEVLKEYAKIKGVSLNEFITSLIRKELNDKTAF